MAIFMGQAGAFQEEKVAKRRERMLLTLFVGMGVFCLVMGYLTAKQNLLWTLVALGVSYLAFRRFDRLFNEQMRAAKSEDHGASGEREVARVLEALPDTFTVVNDLDFADSYGNIDLLVIGPTGIFAVDVKNWRGTVSTDGKGELLLNGRATDKPQVRAFTARTMDLKDRLRALTKLDPYIQCVFVFPRTHIEAKWGTTGSVHCIHAEQLTEYVSNGRCGKSLASAEIPRVISAVKALKETAGPATATT